MECYILNNHRPVSNLRFVSKLIEITLIIYLINNNHNESLQFAYKSSHNTDTALVRMKNYSMMSIDKVESVLLVLLDLSAAFDTVDHNLLFSLG